MLEEEMSYIFFNFFLRSWTRPKPLKDILSFCLLAFAFDSLLSRNWDSCLRLEAMVCVDIIKLGSFFGHELLTTFSWLYVINCSVNDFIGAKALVQHELLIVLFCTLLCKFFHGRSDAELYAFIPVRPSYRLCATFIWRKFFILSLNWICDRGIMKQGGGGAPSWLQSLRFVNMPGPFKKSANDWYEFRFHIFPPFVYELYLSI